MSRFKDIIHEMNEQELRMTRLQLKNWELSFRNSQGGLSPLDWLAFATEDYIGCRCLLLSGILEPGYVLGQQCIEKALKAHLCAEFNGNPPTCSHDLKAIIRLLPNLKISTADEDLIRHLQTYHLISRYPDSERDYLLKNGKINYDGSMIDRIDVLYVALILSIGVPIQVLFRSSFFSYICEKKNSVYKKYLTTQNSSLAMIGDGIGEIYQKARDLAKA